MRRLNLLLVVGIAILSLGNAWAGPDDDGPKVTDPSIPLSYVGNDGSIAIGINSEGESEGKLTGVFARNDERAFIEQLWWDRSGAGGIQSDYNWLWGMTAQEAIKNPDQATVARFSFALDQNGEHDRKATLGFGIERQAFSIEGYIARGISAARNDGIGLQSDATTIDGTDEIGKFTQVETTTVETIFASKPFDSEVGLQVSHFFEPLSMRVHAGTSFQNGDGARSNTLSFGFDAPLGKTAWGVSGLAEHVSTSGGIGANDDDRFSLFLRYEFGRHGSFVPTSELTGPAWIARSIARSSSAHSRTVETYRVRRSQTTSVSRSPKQYTNLFPLAQNDTATVTAGASVLINVLANDNDPDGNMLSLISVSTPSSGTAVISGDHILYTPAAGFVGVDSFRYSVSDGQGGTASALVAVTVDAPLNQPPVIRDDSARAMSDQSVVVNVLANDSDPDGDVLSVVDIGTPSHGSATLSGNVVTYTPLIGFSGRDSFTYKASDGRGAEGTATVRVTVAMQPNRNPFANDDNATTTGAPVNINVLANDNDPDGDPLSIVSLTTPVSGGAAVISGSAVMYTPAAGFVGIDRFAYTISDSQGGTATAMVNVNVTRPANQPPVAASDSYTLPLATSTVVLPVLANDSDPDGDPLTIISVTQPNFSHVSITDSGHTLTFERGSNLPVTFNYTISDGRGGTATTVVNVTILPAPNQPPVAASDSYTLPLATSTVVLPVLANDSDPDGDPLTIISVTQPNFSHVSITDSGHTLTFERGSNLPVTFNYTISDGRGGTATAVVNVTILPAPNKPPVAVADVYTLPGNVLNVLNNDSDPDGDPLTIISVTQPVNGGAVTITDSGQTLTVNNLPNVTVTFNYTISDGRGGTATAQVTVNPEVIH